MKGIYIKSKCSAILGIVLFFIIILGQTLPVLAEELEEMQTELDSITQQIQQQLEKVKKIKTEVKAATTDVEEIEIELDQSQTEVRTVENKLIATKRQVDENKTLLENTEKSLASRNETLKKRIRSIYMFGQVSYLDVFMGVADVNDFVNRYELLRRILRSDVELIAAIKSERQLVTQKRLEIERDLAVLEELKKIAIAKRAVVASRHQAKRSVLDRIESRQDEAERAYNNLQQASSRIEKMIRARKGGSSPPGSIVTGSYIVPTNGTVTSNFGWRTHPVFGNQRLHAGMDIGADHGEDIVAADGGVVISSGTISGYGKTIIIEHNATYSTLYAHSSELLVSEGQVVKKGQLIARVGETGYTTGPNLHFEVRVNGSPVDPREYI